MDPAVSAVYSVRWDKPGSGDGGDSDWIVVILLFLVAAAGLWWYAQKPKG